MLKYEITFLPKISQCEFVMLFSEIVLFADVLHDSLHVLLECSQCLLLSDQLLIHAILKRGQSRILRLQLLLHQPLHTIQLGLHRIDLHLDLRGPLLSYLFGSSNFFDFTLSLMLILLFALLVFLFDRRQQSPPLFLLFLAPSSHPLAFPCFFLLFLLAFFVLFFGLVGFAIVFFVFVFFERVKEGLEFFRMGGLFALDFLGRID